MNSLLPEVSFYIAAHQDDWQLFRGNWAFNDNKYGANVVFLYITAGDDGLGEVFWRAREAAAVASVEAITGCPACLYSQEDFLGKTITCYQSSSTRSYFLRLPDGGFNKPGEGYERTGFQSLTKLRTEGRPMTAVDNSVNYATWQELIDTVSAIAMRETNASSSTNPWINTSRHDRTTNSNDHFDHYEVGEIVAAFSDQRYQVVGWAGYDNRTRKIELDALEQKRTLMRAYRMKMKELFPGFDEAKAEVHDEVFMDCEGE